MTDTTWTRRASAASRLAAALMVIAVAGCDNVEWGGIDLSVVPPPPTAAVSTDEQIEAADRLPDGPIVYYVRRDSLRAEVRPLGEITDEGLSRIEIGDAPDAFGTRFISAFMREGAELTLFSRGRRAGTFIVDSAAVPEADACRRLPRAYGHMELSGSAGEALEFLAMARTQAPTGRTIPGEALEVDRRMRVLGPMIAERALRARGAQLPNWNNALRQIVPFPVSEARDMGFTATFLVDDELRVGNDDLGYSLFIVAVPQGQAGYDSAYVRFANYPNTGKQAPRLVDYLDWDRDGVPELLLQIYGTRNAWFEAIGQSDGDWDRLMEDPCDETAGAAVATDTAPPAPGEAAPGEAAPGQDPARQQPTGQPQQQQPPEQQQGGAPASEPTGQPGDTSRAAAVPTVGVPDLVPQVRLAIPGQRRPAPDTASS